MDNFFKKTITLFLLFFFTANTMLFNFLYADESRRRQLKEYHHKIEKHMLELKEKYPDLKIDIEENSDGFVKIELLEENKVTIDEAGIIQIYERDKKIGEINILEDFRESLDSLRKGVFTSNEEKQLVADKIDQKIEEGLKRGTNTDLKETEAVQQDQEEQSFFLNKFFKLLIPEARAAEVTERDLQRKELLYEKCKLQNKLIKLVIMTTTFVLFTSIIIFFSPAIQREYGIMKAAANKNNPSVVTEIATSTRLADTARGVHNGTHKQVRDLTQKMKTANWYEQGQLRGELKDTTKLLKVQKKAMTEAEEALVKSRGKIQPTVLAKQFKRYAFYAFVIGATVLIISKSVEKNVDYQMKKTLNEYYKIQEKLEA